MKPSYFFIYFYLLNFLSLFHPFCRLYVFLCSRNYGLQSLMLQDNAFFVCRFSHSLAYLRTSFSMFGWSDHHHFSVGEEFRATALLYKCFSREHLITQDTEVMWCRSQNYKIILCMCLVSALFKGLSSGLIIAFPFFIEQNLDP